MYFTQKQKLYVYLHTLGIWRHQKYIIFKKKFKSYIMTKSTETNAQFNKCYMYDCVYCRWFLHAGDIWLYCEFSKCNYLLALKCHLQTKLKYRKDIIQQKRCMNTFVILLFQYFTYLSKTQSMTLIFILHICAVELTIASYFENGKRSYLHRLCNIMEKVLSSMYVTGISPKQNTCQVICTLCEYEKATANNNFILKTLWELYV